MSNIKVSIICNTYNHAPYIGKALESFLMQECSFDFEILVHDDASTDGTQDIIKKYSERYPTIIKPIFQTENQYSKGGSTVFKLQFSRVKGDYIAFCEGDDYWIDPHKLQKQFNALENCQDLNMCASLTYLEEDGKIKSFFPKEKEQLLSPQKVILNGGGYLGSCSLFFRKSFHDYYFDVREKYRSDYCMQILGSLHKGIYLIHEPLCVYRRGVAGSWTKRVFSNNANRLKHDSFIVEMLRFFDEFTDGKYQKCIEYAIDQFLMDIAIIQNDKIELRRLSKKLFSNYYKKEKKIYGFKTRLKNFVKYFLYSLGIYLRKKD